MPFLSMPNAVTERDRRAIMLGAVFIALALLVGRGTPAVVHWTTREREAARTHTADLANAQADAALLTALQDSLHQRYSAYRDLTKHLLRGASPTSAATALATLVSTTAAESNVTLGAVALAADTGERDSQTTRPAPTGVASMVDRAVLTTVSVRGDITGDIHGVTQFVSALEEGPTLLAISHLAITQSEPAGPDDRMERLHATFTVVGLAVAPSGKSKDDSAQKDKSRTPARGTTTSSPQVVSRDSE